MSLYNLRSLTRDSYMIAKFDADFNVESTYTLSASRNGHFDCDCPAGSRSVVTKPCRHRLMLPALLPAVDTERFYDYDTKKFCEPLGDLISPTADQAEPDTLTTEEIVALSDGVEKDFHKAMQSEGEALRNDSTTTFEQDQITGHISQMDEEANVACAANRVEPSAPTIRRR